MTIEQNLKSIIGEQVFQICALSAQIEELRKELESLKAKKDKNEK